MKTTERTELIYRGHVLYLEGRFWKSDALGILNVPILGMALEMVDQKLAENKC